MDKFDWSAPELDIIFDDDEDEFDIQPRLLKKRTKVQDKFYVVYDKFNNTVISISPESTADNLSIRTGVFTTERTELVEKIFTGAVPLNKLSISYNKKTQSRELIAHNKSKSHGEFDYVFAYRSAEPAPIHITCDLVFKKITVDIHYDRFKEYMSADELDEISLERSNAHIQLFCIDPTDPTRLLDKLTVNIFELCNSQRLEKKCIWLPDDPAGFDKVGFIYYNNDLPISFSTQTEVQLETKLISIAKPQLIYRQEPGKILIQSTMEYANNYKINDYINLFFYQQTDPTRLLFSRKIPRAELNSFNLIELDTTVQEPVRIITDHHHIHIEDGNVSTYYRI